jgi:hypothetical protein
MRMLILKGEGHHHFKLVSRKEGTHKSIGTRKPVGTSQFCKKTRKVISYEKFGLDKKFGPTTESIEAQLFWRNSS